MAEESNIVPPEITSKVGWTLVWLVAGRNDTGVVMVIVEAAVEAAFAVIIRAKLLLLLILENLLSLPKDSLCHWITQKPCLEASFASGSSLQNADSSSFFGDSTPKGPIPLPIMPALPLRPPLKLGGPWGQADCHRNASVEIMGGRTGLFSKIRSNSSITLVERRGSNYN